MPDPLMVLSANGVWVEQLDVKVRPPILGVLRSTVRRITGNVPDGFDQSRYVTEYLGMAVNRMSGVPDEVFHDISTAIAQGIEANESPAEIAARVDAILTVTGNDKWSNRAVVVGRTETTGAVNAGTLAAAGQRAIDERRPMVKTWIATTRLPSAERTRPAHLEADGQTVALHEPFTVGGEPLQYPGDPRGSAGNVIQCRCTLSVSAADERQTNG